MPPRTPISSISGSMSGSCKSGKEDRQDRAEDRADDELALGADVPGVGEVAERQADRDQDDRRRLDDQLLERPAVGQRLDEVDVERLERIDAVEREDDEAVVTTVSATAISGERSAIARDGCGRRTSSSRMLRLRRRDAVMLVVDAAHQQPDLVGGHRLGRIGRRQPARRRAPRCGRRSRRSRRGPG